MTLRADLTRAISAARDRAIATGAIAVPDGATLPEIGLERPANPDHGDWASNAAMQLAPVARAAPLRIADAIVEHLERPPSVAAVEVAPPGFLNFRIDPGWIAAQVGPMLEAGPTYGRGTVARPLRINVEFVSANPTGPLTVGNARGAFVGDVLSRVLEAAGHQVTREYYFNDYNEQIRNLGLTLLALRRNEPIPEDGYHGDYVNELVAQVPDALWSQAEEPDADGGEILGRWASERVRAGIEASLARLGVRFDVWTSEGAIHEAGWVERGIGRLKDAGYMYEDGGALWFRSSALGDDKDRVVIRSNGRPTYFAADIGYVAEKFSRGFDELIYVWGEDHHGTVARNRAAAVALGFDAERVRWPLIAWVRFVRDGVEIPMSKRSGEFITLDELLNEVGTDGARWYFSSRAYTTGIDFDLELAKKQSNENPVYYVQYAHARASSILRNAAESGAQADAARSGELLRHPSEQALIGHLLDFPDAIAMAAERRETHEVPRYAYELASAFSQFYRDCKVLTDDAALTASRLALVDATRGVLANALDLLGISAPDQM
ncbi:MAG TPA: arginine--tRNA ligase [Candidatus Limnocylindria bacterium]|nr:arginine--tRNA ligase [Candidatus Limnocylindria bacterium]